MENPKAFISYCWSSDGDEWVTDLAKRLVVDGVDLKFDKWDLREGHDKYLFMETMVNDPTISKVIIVSDKKYAEKANGREGGVGTESYLISQEIYESQTQEKFVAIVRENDEEGKPYLPAYCKSRLYIDFSDENSFSDSYSKLLRWAWNKPADVKPEIGKMPSFLEDGSGKVIDFSTEHHMCIAAIKGNKATAYGTFNDFCEKLEQGFENFRINNANNIEDEVLKSIETFLPYRDKIISLFDVIALNSTDKRIINRIHKLFENLLFYTAKPPNVTSYRPCEFDNFRFIIHELFLYTLAVLLNHSLFEDANYLLTEIYYVPSILNNKHPTSNYRIINRDTSVFEMISSQRNSRRISFQSDLLRERCNNKLITFSQLMQADFIAYLRSIEPDSLDYWWPFTLLFSYEQEFPFEIFARSSSMRYFEQITMLLNISSKSELLDLLSRLNLTPNLIPKWGWRSLEVNLLMGIDSLGSHK